MKASSFAPAESGLGAALPQARQPALEPLVLVQSKPGRQEQQQG
jgi:hypothetical protein